MPAGRPDPLDDESRRSAWRPVRSTNLARVSLTEQQDSQAVSLIRGISMDGPLAANSGHQGTGMALAPLAHVLYSRVMKHDPSDPHWSDRDRFVLSNGHVSIMQYAMLFLSGYGLELDDLKHFRQWGSATPGHPEVGHTAGVEVTTGPLGQGFANAVGMAIAEANQRARFGADAVDHHTFVIAGDGCMMEGISHEAADLAGHLGLGHLICIFDDNKITIDGETDLTTNVDMAARFRAYGWDVVDLGDIGDDLDAIEAALNAAKETDKPSFLMLRTHVARPVAEVGGRPQRSRQPVHRRGRHRDQGRHGDPRRAVLGARRPRRRVPRARRRARRGRARPAGAEPTSPEWVAAQHGEPGSTVGTPTCPATNWVSRSPLARRSRRRSTRRFRTCPV